MGLFVWAPEWVRTGNDAGIEFFRVGRWPIFCMSRGETHTASNAMSATREKLIGLLEPAIEALGYELTDLELNIGHGRGLVRVFIDRAEGITLADCERVSHQVSGVLDVEDPIASDYNLEVSSPGADRKLVKPEHFDRFAGHTVKVRLKRLIDGRRRITGQLLGRSDDRIQVRLNGKDLSIEIEDIEVARVVPDWNEFVRAGRA